MTYKDIEELQALLDRDIRGVIAKGDITPKDYQCLDVAIDITKDLGEIAEGIMKMEEATSDGFSGRYNDYSYEMDGGNSGFMGRRNGSGYYPRMRSGARGGNGNNGGNRGNGGNSGHMGVEDKLNVMMQNAANEQERQIISKIMKEVKDMEEM